jgi:hypothetical protein
MFALILLGLLVLADLAVLSGRTHDSRDPEYGLGKVIQRRASRPADR